MSTPRLGAVHHTQPTLSFGGYRRPSSNSQGGHTVRVLLVEDDPMVGEALIQALRDAAFAVDLVVDGGQALTALEQHSFDVVLLDLGLPGKSGLEVLRVLRARGDGVAVIIVTARDAIEDRIQGLDLGADDYLVKPFDLGELLARIRAALRRRGGSGVPVLSNGRLSLDPALKQVMVDGVMHALSNREFQLLFSLMLRPGAVLSRVELEERIYGWNEPVESNVVEYIIHNLRRKVGVKGILNVRGLGWMVEREC